MAHPYFHSLSSKRKHGGKVEDYLSVHTFFDATKSVCADARHRLVLHNDAGVLLMMQAYGSWPNYELLNSDGNLVPLLSLGYQHVLEDFGRTIEVGEVVRLLNHKLVFHPDKALALFMTSLGKNYLPEDFFPLLDVLGIFYSMSNNDNKGWSLMCNSFGIWLLESLFGVMYQIPSTNSTAQLPTRFIAEKLVLGGYGFIPNLSDILDGIEKKSWMYANAAALDRLGRDKQLDGNRKEETI